MEVTYITSNPRSGKLGMLNNVNDSNNDDDNDDDDNNNDDDNSDDENGNNNDVDELSTHNPNPRSCS